MHSSSNISNPQIIDLTKSPDLIYHKNNLIPIPLQNFDIIEISNPNELPHETSNINSKQIIDLTRDVLDSENEIIITEKEPKNIIRIPDEIPKKNPTRSPELRCVICNDYYCKPTSTVCGHIFCYRCILQSLSFNSTCPICRERVSINQIHRRKRLI